MNDGCVGCGAPGHPHNYCERCAKVELMNDLLTHAKIDWNLWVSMGGNIRELIREAKGFGDVELARKAMRALRRRRL